MLITMPLTREDANVLCFSCSTGLHLSHIAFVKCPIGGKIFDRFDRKNSLYTVPTYANAR